MELFTDHGATLLRTIQHLPALTDLDVSYLALQEELREPLSSTNGLPACKELADMHSRSLTRLDVSMLGGPSNGNTLRLIGLPELQSCRLSGEPHVRRATRADEHVR